MGWHAEAMATSVPEHAPGSDVPESWRPARRTGQRASLKPRLSERVKDRMLGPVLPNEALAHERLGRPTALAVFSSDALSSTAYATEEILRTLLPAAGGIGLLAYAKVMPITIAMVLVLAILMFSYRQTIKAYPSAGGAYIVTKDNLGLLPAQVAGVALLTDYVLTVAVSVSAGTAALYSAVPSIYAWRVPVALVFIALISWGNLRGVKESGRLFAAPTYFFIVGVLIVMIVGAVKSAFGDLPVTPPSEIPNATEGVTLFLLLHAFASGGAAMTGVEAISNGVPAFKPPEWKNARSTLMVMGTLLGTMFLGLSWLASKMHPVPSDSQTVIAQIAKGVIGDGPQFFAFQLFTLLILVLAANTSFADFPRLASFHAEDAFMPRQLTKRGHRLAFSNGILFLAVAAGFLVVLFGADVTHLIPLYAIGVFTSFTLSQAGMAKRHLRLREPKWGLGLAINGAGAIATGIVTLIIAITKFSHGAWAIMLLVPLLVAALVRLNHQYEAETEELHGPKLLAAVAQPVPARTVSVVLIDGLDTAAAAALRAARTLRTDRTEAVHFSLDDQRTAKLMEAWEQFHIDHLDLRVVDCPDRQLIRRTSEYVLELVADGRTQVSVLIPRLIHRRGWHTLLHDRTSEELSAALARLPNVTVTIVPHLLGGESAVVASPEKMAAVLREAGDGDDPSPSPVIGDDERQTMGELDWRSRATVEGKVVQLVVETTRGVPSIVAVLDDGTGQVDLLFLGRRQVGGVALGACIRATGMAAAHRERLTMLNPEVDIVAPAPHLAHSPLKATHHD